MSIYNFELSNSSVELTIHNDERLKRLLVKNFSKYFAVPINSEDGRMTVFTRPNATYQDMDKFINDFIKKYQSSVLANTPGNNVDLQEEEDKNKVIGSIKVTTGFTIANRDILEELDVISAEVVYGANIFKDMFSAVRDVVGGRSKAIQNLLKDAKTEAMFELKTQAYQLEADAIIGIDIDYQEISGGGKSMLMLAISGTAVKLKPIVNCNLN